jgi:hypothetical protein
MFISMSLPFEVCEIRPINESVPAVNILRPCVISSLVILIKELCREIDKLQVHLSQRVFTCQVNLLTSARPSNMTLDKLVFIIRLSLASVQMEHCQF